MAATFYRLLFGWENRNAGEQFLSNRRTSQILKKIITLEHPTDMLAVYQDEALSNAYQYFIRGNDNSSSIRKNRTLLQALYQKFNLEKTKENQLRISDYIWLYFNRKSQQNIDEIKKEMLDTYFEQYFSFVQFHPSFDYTDFFDGLRPVRSDGSELGFELKNGLFKQFVVGNQQCRVFGNRECREIGNTSAELAKGIFPVAIIKKWFSDFPVYSSSRSGL